MVEAASLVWLITYRSCLGLPVGPGGIRILLNHGKELKIHAALGNLADCACINRPGRRRLARSGASATGALASLRRR